MYYNKIKLGIYTAVIFMAASISINAATFTVTNTNNAGAGSLRQAVLDANAAAGSDTIVFDSSFNSPQTITLASFLLINPTTASDALTISGPGANLLTVSGNNAIGIFNLSAGRTASISGMTLAQSGTTAITNFGVLTVTDAAFNSNTGTSGGAITNNGDLTVTNVIFDSNIGTIGGALNTANSATSMVVGCTFTNNIGNGGGATGNGGGAIYNGGMTTVIDSTFTGNMQTASGGPTGGAIRSRFGTLNVTNSTFTNNTSANGGGAISNNEIANISGCTFNGNSTTMGNAHGGAIGNFGANQTTISNSVITGNSALGSGGGIYYSTSGGTPFLTITNSTISNNTANSDSDTTGDGGGIEATGTGSITITGSTINGNTSNTGGSTSGDGGGIDVAVQMTLTNSTVSGNMAGRLGGGIQSTGGSTEPVTFTSVTIVNNTTTGNGGGFARGSGTGAVNFRNTIVANNTDQGPAPDILGLVTSNGFNLIENTTGATISGGAATTITGQDPNLGPLQDNGGVTFTHALLAGGPAIDKGESSGTTADQRQQTRPVDNPSIPNASGGDGADMGAYEIQPILVFSSATYSIGEGGGTATITVNRIDGGGDVDSVQYATSDGSATGGATCGGGVDYQNASGTLTFNPADTSQTFTVTICDDAQFKGNETINLTLSSPVGATLGIPSAAVLTILNNDTPTPTNTATNTPTPTPTSPPAITGTVTYGNAIGAPTPRFVSNVTITGAGSPTVSTTTGAPGPTAGQYSLSGFGAGSYTVTPTKTTGQNGISSNDAARVAQHVSAIALLTGNQLIVADVSNNGSISSNDAALIARFAASLGPPVGITGTWRFTPVNRSYASVGDSIPGQDYSALLMGEVSGNWNNTGARPIRNPQSAENSDTDSDGGPERAAAVGLPDLSVPLDKEIIVPINVEGLANKGVISYEFDLRYDPSVIQPVGDPVDLKDSVSRGLSVVTNASEPGLLRVVVYGPMPINENGVLLNLRFTAVGAVGSVSPLSFERIVFNEGEPRVNTADGQIELF